MAMPTKPSPPLYLARSATVTLSFQEGAFQVADHNGNVSASQSGLMPGFSLYQGLAHVAPMGADYDSSDISKANRPGNTEGAFRAVNDWVIGNAPDTVNGIPASLSFFKYVGSAYDGTASARMARPMARSAILS